MSEPWDDPAAVEWARHVLDEMVPKIDSSAVGVSFAPPRGDSVGDVKYWVELGYMICADKPIMVVVLGDREMPEHLSRVADEILHLPETPTPEAGEQLAQAVRAFAERFPE